MQLSVFVLAAFAAFASLLVEACYYETNFRSKAGGTRYYIANYSCKRVCVCMRDVTTYSLEKGASAGTLKAFASHDCSGAYSTIANGQVMKNAQWVNSISHGPSGASSWDGTCPNSFPY
ncbi:hypothetical protein BC940DRAFT_303064 [Gongronella butleri]|nr:hypothetical protein BC940DRAFT_303064 [Gongronella butleri]